MERDRARAIKGFGSGMTKGQADIYAIKEEPFAPARRGLPRPGITRGWRQSGPRWISRIVALLIIAAISAGAYNLGMRLRDKTWRSTRPIRFQYDIANAYHFASEELALVEAREHLSGKEAFKQMTLRQVLSGIVFFYHDIALSHPDANYDLDYPPLRLTTMTLWVWHVRKTNPTLIEYPRERRPADDQGDKLEDIAYPVLMLNTVCDGIAAIAMFFLVWLWIHRSDRASGASLLDARIASEALPRGIIAFALATAGFWFALITVILLPRMISEPSIQWASRAEWHRILTFGDFTWPDPTVWYGLFALFLIMVISARRLPPPHRGWACGLVAALLVWFNPMNLLDSHVWPQWDVWIIPVFLLGALFASLNWWILAGAIIGAGCMSKGQLLIGMPVLLLWPLMSGRFFAALGICAGFALGAAAIVWPWIIDSSSTAWLESVVLSVVLMLIAVLAMRPALWRAAAQLHAAGRAAPSANGRRHWLLALLIGETAACACIIAGFLLVWNLRLGERHIGMGITLIVLGTLGGAAALYHAMHKESNSPGYRALIVSTWLISISAAACVSAGILLLRNRPDGAFSYMGLSLLLLGVLIPPWIFPLRGLQFWIAAIFASAIWMAAQARGNFDWLAVGFAYGAYKHDVMQLGAGSFSNLPTILSRQYNWNLHDLVGVLHLSAPLFKWKKNIPLDVRTFLQALYGIVVVICSLAAAVHARRKDPRFLAAITAPWILFPVILGQMTERYLLWPAVLSAVLIAISTGMTLLHVVLTILVSGMIYHQIMGAAQRSDWWQSGFEFFARMFPNSAWAMILLAMIFLITALTPSRKPPMRRLL